MLKDEEDKPKAGIKWDQSERCVNSQMALIFSVIEIPL